MTHPMLSAGLLILIFVCLGLVFWGLRQTTQHFTPAVQRQWLWRYSLGIMSWLGVLAVLAGSGFLSQFEALPPRMPFVVLAPVVVLVLLLRSRGFQDWLRQVPLSYLTAIQSFRVVVELLLWGMALRGGLPEAMTFEGWNFDILVGLTAPVLAWGVWGANPKARASNTIRPYMMVAWNLLGLGLLAVVATTGFLSLPSPVRVFVHHDVRVLAGFPWVYLPTVLVALAYYGHVLSLWKLWARPKS